MENMITRTSNKTYSIPTLIDEKEWRKDFVSAIEGHDGVYVQVDVSDSESVQLQLRITKGKMRNNIFSSDDVGECNTMDILIQGKYAGYIDFAEEGSNSYYIVHKMIFDGRYRGKGVMVVASDLFAQYALSKGKKIISGHIDPVNTPSIQSRMSMRNIITNRLFRSEIHNDPIAGKDLVYTYLREARQ